MTTVVALPDIAAQLDAKQRAWLTDALARAAENPQRTVPVLFPQLPRRIGRGFAVSTDAATHPEPDESQPIDFGAWRTCDVGAVQVLLAAGGPPADDLLIDLYQHGDMEERTMALRSLAALPISRATIELLGEVQRTNIGEHVEAGALDSDVVARAVDAGTFPVADFNRLMLKLAFSDLPWQRALGAPRHANPELSRMVQDLATEREAATRKVWHDTNRVIALAPTDGSIARLLGGLEHGDDGTRLAAAEGIAHLCASQPDQHSTLADLARERLPREPRPEIAQVLGRATS